MQLRAAVLILLLSSSFINAQEWSVESLSYSMENDTDVDVDGGYTHGARLSVLFLREDFQDSWLKVPYLSFAIANQMYNPYDQDNPELIKDDRPYAGWSYVEVGLHQTSLQDLDSLTLQLGIVGPASKMEELQNAFHGKIDAGNAMGWDNQLSNEVTLQVNYMHKWRYELENIYGLESVIVPYAGANLGNVSIKASGGALYRIGYKIQKDFGMNSMKEGSYSSIPASAKGLQKEKSSWSAYFNLMMGGNLVARDMFLDGNTFTESHSIDKNYVNGYIAAGLTLRYENFSLDYVHNYYTKEYDERGRYKDYRGYGSLILNYNFE